MIQAGKKLSCLDNSLYLVDIANLYIYIVFTPDTLLATYLYIPLADGSSRTDDGAKRFP